MANETVPMTAKGHRKLKEELARLKGPERMKVVRAIEVARGHGDLSENAEYDAAKEAQTQLETRIQNLEDRLARANIIDLSKLSGGDTITFGATVTVADGESGEEKVYQLVGEDEADIKQGLLSVTSPMARAMVGRQEGDVVKVRAPSGERELEILSVRYIPEE
jgi:transcription elongation factor GreA